jgi:hypothetical protein
VIDLLFEESAAHNHAEKHATPERPRPAMAS